MLGLWCAIRPVMVLRVSTLPRTRMSSPHSLIQALRSPVLFCSRKYLLNIWASGISILERTSSLTMTLPLSVSLSGSQPRCIRRSAICFRLAILNGISLVFVFNSTIVGSNSSSALRSNSCCSSSSLASSSCAFIRSKAKPLFCCLSTMIRTSRSRS